MSLALEKQDNNNSINNTEKMKIENENSSVVDEGKDGCMVRVSGGINKKLSNGFYKIGKFAGSYVWTTIGICMLITIGMGYAFSDFKTESDSSKLFVPQGTRSLDDQADIINNWGENPRFGGAVITPINGDNVLDKQVLLDSYDFIFGINDINATYEGKQISFGDLCIKVPSSGNPFIFECLISSMFSKAWNNSRISLENDLDPVATLNNVLTPEERITYLGGQLDGTATITTSPALRFTFLLNPALEDEANEWEKVFVDYALDIKTVNAYPSTIYSFTTEIGGSITGDVGIVSASYFIIIGYVIIMMQSKCDRVEGNTTIALLGILTIGISIVSAFGLCQYLGFLYGNTHTILPFLVLGIGADGLFIMVNAFERTDPREPLPERAALALTHAGVSLTVSSLTNVAAFGIGALTVIPDLSSFCKYAALTMFFLWVYLNTFYVACITLNQKRKDASRLDILCCAKDCRKNDKEDDLESAVSEFEYQPGRLSIFMENKYTPFILHPYFKFPFLVVLIGWVAFSGYNITNLSVEATGSNFLPDGSYLKENFDLQAKYFGGSDTDLLLVTKEFDYYTSRAQVYDLPNKFRFPSTYTTEPPYIRPTFVYWMEQFTQDLELYATGQKIPLTFNVSQADIPVDATVGGGKRFPLSSELFYQYLNGWLNEPTGGLAFKRDFIFTDTTNTQIKRVRTEMAHIPIGEFNDEGVFKESAKKVVDAMDKVYDIVDAVPQPVTLYVYSFKYTDEWASFKIIDQELIQNISLALVCVLIVVGLLIGHPLASGIVFISVCFTVVELLGVQPLIGLSIDTVAVVLFVLSVGLAVDWSVHLCHGFMITKGTRVERIQKVMGDVGVPVLNGGISTFLAICLQALSQSYVFRVVFLDFFFTVLFGLINGLVFLPIVLSLIGPKPYRNADK